MTLWRRLCEVYMCLYYREGWYRKPIVSFVAHAVLRHKYSDFLTRTPGIKELEDFGKITNVVTMRRAQYLPIHSPDKYQVAAALEKTCVPHETPLSSNGKSLVP